MRSSSGVALAGVLTSLALAVASAPVHAQELSFRRGELPVRWETGGSDCSVLQQDFFIHRYNDDFYILRESGCVHAEKPFLYLLFGQDKVILLDTGAGNNTDPETGRVPNVVGAVDFVIDQWLARNNRASIHLVVVHLHSHFDHIWGDPQFISRPDTTFVPPGSVEILQSFFGIRNWPKDIVQYDLGSRILDIIPIPGHDLTHIAVYDRQTAVLLTGDVLYPGRLWINVPDPAVNEDSVERLVDFTKTRAVAHILGTHIEQRGPYVDYPIGTHFAPEEGPLEMGRSELLELWEASKGRTRGNGLLEKRYREFTVCGPYPNCHPVN